MLTHLPRITQPCSLCCPMLTHLPRITRLCSLCCPMLTHLPRITQPCSLCCPQQPTPTLAGPCIFLPVPAVLLCVGCLTSQQHASVSQVRICTDKFTCFHTEREVADQTFYLTPSQYIDTGLTSPSADPVTPGAWQGSHWSANFKVTGMTRPGKIPFTAVTMWFLHVTGRKK